MEHRKDRELMQAYRLGDHKAFETLYMRYRGKLYVYAYSLLAGVHEAQDAMQEVFAKLIANIDGFCKADNVSSFLFAVCRNYSLNVLQSRKLAAREPNSAPFRMLKPGNPFQNAAEREEAEQLNKIIGNLPKELREVLVLKAYSGLTFKQIAETTGQPQGTVATRYRSAIGKIKLSLQAQGR